jgi:hydroxyethylthiazole kinase-like uncharacterized protein yjeF
MAKQRRADVDAVTPRWLARHPLPQPDASDDKDDRGTVLVVGGAMEVPGAVVLAGIGALRAGAGKLQMATCRDVVPQIATVVPEALVAPLDQTPDGAIAATAAGDIVRRGKSAKALLLGPGMMPNDAVAPIVRRVLSDLPDIPIALDAAALGALRTVGDAARARPMPGMLVLTPHAGELATMRGIDRRDVAPNARELAERTAGELRAVVVLKGATTYIACEGERTVCYDAGDVGLATSGSGDTLAGVIAGLLARGAAPMRAAAWGVWLHGEAGNALERRIGRIGFLARELLDEIPIVMARAEKRGKKKRR